jgi:signal peptidase I
MAEQATLDRARRPPPPRATEQLPQWVTLREAAFITDLDELTLRSMVASGVLGADRSLSKRMGERYVLIRSADLEAAGLLPSQRTGQTWPPEPIADLTQEPLSPEPDIPTDPVVRMPEAASAPSPAQAPPPPPPLAPPEASVEAQLWGPPVEEGPDAFLPAAATPIAPSRSLWEPTPAPELAVAVQADEVPAPTPVRTWARSAARSLPVGLAAGLLLVTLGAFALGYRGVAITSGAMEPALHRGDLVLTRPVSPDSVRTGDVVAFHDPAQPSRVLVQRVQRVQDNGGAMRFVTRADAGTTTAAFSVPVSGRVRVVGHRVALVGGVASFVRRDPIAVGIVALVGAILITRLRRQSRVPLIRPLE